MGKKRIRYWAVPLFFLAMLVDAQLSRILLSVSKGEYIWNVNLLLLFLMFGVKKLSKRYMLLASLAIGIVCDFYYIGVLGIYAVIVPLMVWLMYLLYDMIYQNAFTMFFGMVILATLQEVALVSIQLLFGLTTINGAFFVARFLGPTLLINIALFIVGYFPLKKLFILE